jgi:hypothetical protein
MISSLSKIPPELDQTSYSVSKIIGNDLDGLMAWACKLATNELRREFSLHPDDEGLWLASQNKAVKKFVEYRNLRGTVGKRIHSAIEAIVAQPPGEEFDFESLAKKDAHDSEVLESSKAFHACERTISFFFVVCHCN